MNNNYGDGALLGNITLATNEELLQSLSKLDDWPPFNCVLFCGFGDGAFPNDITFVMNDPEHHQSITQTI